MSPMVSPYHPEGLGGNGLVGWGEFAPCLTKITGSYIYSYILLSKEATVLRIL